MPLLGNTKTYGLTNVLKFLSDSRYSGRLRIYYKNRRIDLFLLQGNLRLPLDSNWHPILTLEDFRERELASGDGPEKLRQKVENELYEIFFWERANYVFDRDFLPEKLEEADHQEVNWFIDLHAGNIVMEASRRRDDLERNQENIPRQGRLFYTSTSDLEEYDADIIRYVNGSRDVMQIKEASGKGLYDVVMTLAKLFREDKVSVLSEDQFTSQMEKFIEEKDFESAFTLYSHLLDKKEEVQKAGDIFFTSLRDEAEQKLDVFSGEMSGPQSFRLVYDLIRHEIPIKIGLKGKQSYEVILDKNQFYFRKNENYIHSTVERMVKRDLVSSEYVQDLNKVSLLEEEMLNWVLPENLEPRSVFVSIFAEEMAEMYKEDIINITSQPFEEGLAPEDYITFTLGEETRSTVLDLLKDWENIEKQSPSDRQIVVLVRAAREKYVNQNFPVVGEFLANFHRNRLNLEELRKKIGDKYSIIEFYSKLQTHLQQQDLRFLEVEELKKLITAEIMIENYQSAIRLIEAGKIRASEDIFFQEKLEEIRLKSEGDIVAEDDRLVGDLTSFSLAEVLQNLVTNQLTGTLRIFIPDVDQARKELYFEEGQIYILREEKETSEATVSTFLDSGALEGLQSMAESSEEGGDQYLEEIADVARQEIYELLLWEGATFTFILDALPPKFYTPPENIVKASLDTQTFLMEAIGRLDMWREISQVIPTEKTIFEMTSPEAKLQALATGKNPQIIYMIDGIHNVEDIIRISNMGKLETCSFLYELYQMGLVQPLPLAQLILNGQEAYKRKDYETALKYYDCAIKLNPRDSRLQKILAGLNKLVGPGQQSGNDDDGDE